ncbi:MAG: mechanosensitive ion channel domain-containing protein [Coleofasciculaceae cyanobacterium]
MVDTLPETVSFQLNLKLLLIPLIFAGMCLVIATNLFMPQLFSSLLESFKSSQVYIAYQKIVKPYTSLLWLVAFLAGADTVLFLAPNNELLNLIELLVSLSLTISASWLGSRLFKRFFDDYLLEATVKSGRQVNGELLILGKILANVLIIIVAAVVFAQTHQVNVVGLVASLGISGIAVAFAAQKTLEQLLGGIVIYIDRPFVVEDYIGLPDGTFGRVESIGLRSTKIRTSGKGTLMIVPNSSLTESNIENFTGGKKVISILYLTFYRAVTSEERALIREVILESTNNIFGINSRRTEVIFRDFFDVNNQEITQAQTSFFILGSGEVSMELRRQLLDIATQKITSKLQEYGIDFDIEEPNIYVDSPITI